MINLHEYILLNFESELYCLQDEISNDIKWMDECNSQIFELLAFEFTNVTKKISKFNEPNYCDQNRNRIVDLYIAFDSHRKNIRDSILTFIRNVQHELNIDCINLKRSRSKILNYINKSIIKEIGINIKNII